MRLALLVAVKTLTGFSTQPSPRKTLSGDDARPVAWFFKILVVDGLHDWVGDIQGRQVHQFKGAEFEAHLVTQNSVDGGEVSHAFADDAQSLCAITASCMVDDEARRVLR